MTERLTDGKMNETEKRIQAILGEDRGRTAENAERYREYLLKQLALPIRAMGREDFLWEEPYLIGGWSKTEYRKLKRTHPSYTDTFEIEGLAPPDEFRDVLAKVRRVKDGMRFEIGLSWLRCKDENHEAHQLMEDYGYWHTNY